MKYYEIVNHLSGTTWLKGKGANLFINYWKFPESYIRELSIHDRPEKERLRFVRALCDMLNDINEPKPKHYMCSMFAGKMEFVRDMVFFYDCLLGEIKIENFEIKPNEWIKTEIPEEVRKDLENGFELTLNHNI